jgi:hypothetical protein
VVQVLSRWAALPLISSAAVDGYRLLVLSCALQKLQHVADIRVSHGRVVRRQSVQLVTHFVKRCCCSPWARVFSASNFVLGLVVLFSTCILLLIDSVNNNASMVVGVVVAGMLLLAASAFGCLLARRRIQVAVCHSLRHFGMRFALAACCMHETLSSRLYAFGCTGTSY